MWYWFQLGQHEHHRYLSLSALSARADSTLLFHPSFPVWDTAVWRAPLRTAHANVPQNKRCLFSMVHFANLFTDVTIQCSYQEIYSLKYEYWGCVPCLQLYHAEHLWHFPSVNSTLHYSFRERRLKRGFWFEDFTPVPEESILHSQRCKRDSGYNLIEKTPHTVLLCTSLGIFKMSHSAGSRSLVSFGIACLLFKSSHSMWFGHFR